ncbi:MAG: DnaJ domain-containing protein [Desulfobacterales bacterium]|nr:DnaJ domain-containing protein [Desulfobacterales bacterium]
MSQSQKIKSVSSEKIKANGCLSCGTSESIGNRKYCSIKCRQRLRYKLDIRTGLLRALNAKYATFYFTEEVIVMDMLPYGSKEIFSYILPRSTDKNPADDFSRMADILGNAWWAEKNRTKKNYLATHYIYKHASKNNKPVRSIKPVENKIPTIEKTVLLYLKLGRPDLHSLELKKTIKNAYRKQAKIHHPDHGGDTASFRKIHMAYEQLIAWAENPSFINRRGFPGKWFYDGSKNKWIQPTPI